ncbi:unnamed protein product [Nippostrongylus brasiliensis]|uniref:t-SNARE coiled-coil homology domain-containing protein n=1 Tax=Nippostrongylus brasiliensis TaxID=27835 RepID=A0A0N4Y6D9_NIPBR|nr:unnamed protein product [Nippostrongylus brasiliensis]
MSANKNDRPTDDAAPENKEAEWTNTTRKTDWTTTSTNDVTSEAEYQFQKEVLKTLDKIVSEFDSLYDLVDTIDNRIDKLNEQIETIELKVDGNKKLLEGVDNDIEDVKHEVSRVLKYQRAALITPLLAADTSASWRRSNANGAFTKQTI